MTDPVFLSVTIPDDDPDYSYELRAELIPGTGWSQGRWLVGKVGDNSLRSIYIDEIDAYIELLTAMKNYKEEQ